MKKIVFIIFLLLMFPFGIYGADQEENKIHPSFMWLLKTKPRNREIMYPSVPRVSAEEAFQLFSTGKAIIFGVGLQMNKQFTILGTVKVPEGSEMNPKLLRKLKTIKNKYILVFCA